MSVGEREEGREEIANEEGRQSGGGGGGGREVKEGGREGDV